MVQKCDSRTVEEFKEAWLRGDSVFPQHPEEEGQRWFLRTPVSSATPARNENLVFIGMNPSTAANFAPRTEGGDPTTERILNYDDFKIGNYCQMTIINLIPLIGQSEKSKTSSKKLPTWSDEAGKKEIQDSYWVTREVIKLIVKESHTVHLMWGCPSSRFPWKKDVLPFVKKWLHETITNQNVQAFLSKKGHPLHPGFGGIKQWEGKTLADDVRFILET
ncbi:DUF1643 domain-containing protein [Mobiluncus curtisii]|uniref:Uracil-DNA glycosylase-like domain-containing protein n=2 Tax=Mobiluncus curtisii TaxID=2051 RepID=D6ZK26_MOBCV|nr:DUF1643 domain-containing protein [Mobiluncus curtisii]ADI67075.1 hypothetical protein HMPREF0573_10756 [Mobiluncus curtisii ATCC 43063]MCU9987981.1 DUF1643 domain-containing protein [Mobiluncus curtisii]MCV0001199.1 DUF1643 domain-containing protein [Mobiluncus curtisii]NMW50018.1 DUF1643 domain-containing protein [Mobiluncus curtisii]NMW87984.1 DUF1643 domain-containing protein [Mobiluncus curtisii]